MAEPPDDLLATFGRRLSFARIAAGLTQDDIASRIGRTRSSVANMEAGRQNPQLLTLALLAQALGVSIGALVGEINDDRIDSAAELWAEWRRLDAEAKRLAAEAAVAKKLFAHATGGEQGG